MIGAMITITFCVEHCPSVTHPIERSKVEGWSIKEMNNILRCENVGNNIPTLDQILENVNANDIVDNIVIVEKVGSKGNVLSF